MNEKWSWKGKFLVQNKNLTNSVIDEFGTKSNQLVNCQM